MATAAVSTTTSPDSLRALPRRVAAIVVVSFCLGVSIVVFVGSLILELPLVGEQVFVMRYVVNAIVYGPVSALVIWRRADFVSVVLAIMAVGSAISAAGSQWAYVAVEHPELPGLWVSQHILDRLWLPGTLAAFAFLPLLLTNRAVTRPAFVMAVVGSVASILPVVVAVLRQRPGAEPNPLAHPDPAVQDALVLVFYWSLGVVVLLAILTGLILLHRLLTWPPGERRGLGWLVVGQWLLILFFSPSLLAWFPNLAYTLFGLAPLAAVIAQLFMPAAILVLALGQRMWGLDIAVNRAIVSTLLVVTLMLGYVSVALFADAVLPVPPTIAGVVGVAAFALAVDPVRRWIQRRVDSLVYGVAAEPAALMRSLGAQLGEGSAGAELQRLVEALRGTLRLESLSVVSARADGVSARAGIPGAGPETSVELRNANDSVGVVRATAPGNQALDRRTAEVLKDISGVLSVALQLADVNEESRQARDRIVEVRDEERRMVRRELHDGLAPALAATLGELGRVPALLPDPPSARESIDEIRSALATRTSDVRDLARTLLPTSLDSGDLDAALTELATRFSSRDITIAVRSADASELDFTRQAVVYHIVAEAVLLSRRTPRVTRIDIGVESRDGECVVTVTHDGDSRDSDTAVVIGSITDRADDLGGSITVDRREDGLELTVVVPS